MTKQAEQSNTARIFMSNMWNELDQVAWVWNELLLEKEIIKNPYLLYFSTVFQFFGFGFFFLTAFSLKYLICVRQGVWQISLLFFSSKGWCRPGYSASESVPSSSAVSNHVSHAFTYIGKGRRTVSQTLAQLK